MKRRRFYRDILNHCYQRTADSGVLFYSYTDHLVYFTTYCILARKHNIRVLSLCQMPDHTHDSISAKSLKALEDFKREVNSRYARNYNKAYGRKGPLFESPFGSAPKKGDKAARTHLIYIGNNPVERQLVTKAEEYQWNYLAYANTVHPFSDKLLIHDARWPLQRAVKEVKAQFGAGLPLTFAQMNRLFEPLDTRERCQLADFIVVTYNVIDYGAAARFFDGYDHMLQAMHSTTGSEYDLNEVFIGKNDTHYSKMSAVLRRRGLVKEIHEILGMPIPRRQELFQVLRRETGAMSDQIAKFLHLPLQWR